MADDEFDDDSLSDLTDNDELYDNATQGTKAKMKRAARGDFRVSGALKMPRVATYSTWSVYQQLTSGDIDLEAEYQRGVVWPDTKQTGVIDSVFKNFFIPPVIFVVKMDQDGAEKRVCIDGKQRLTSLWRFIDGEIPYRDPDTGKKWWYKMKADQKGGSLIPERFRKVFNSKQVVAVEYEDLNDNTEREIFQRVQMGMALTPAEKLKAINTPMSRYISELCNSFVNNGLEDQLNWDTARSADFRCVASAVYCILNPAGKAKTSCTVPALDKWLKKPNEVDSSIAASLRQTFAIFLAITRDSKLNALFDLPATKLAPVEFVMAAILIHQYKDQCTLSQLADAILSMRRDVRAREKDIRTNNRIMNLMYEFIDNVSVTNLKANPKDTTIATKSKEVRRLLANPSTTHALKTPESSQLTSPQPKSSQKRKHVDEASSSSSVVEVPTPKKPKSSASTAKKTATEPRNPPSQTTAPSSTVRTTPMKRESISAAPAPTTSPSLSSPLPPYQPPPSTQPSHHISSDHIASNQIPATQPTSSSIPIPRTMTQRPPSNQFPPSFAQPMASTQIHPDRLAALRAATSQNLHERPPAFYQDPVRQQMHMQGQYSLPDSQPVYSSSQFGSHANDYAGQYSQVQSQQFATGVNGGSRDNGWGARGGVPGRGS